MKDTSGSLCMVDTLCVLRLVCLSLANSIDVVQMGRVVHGFGFIVQMNS